VSHAPSQYADDRAAVTFELAASDSWNFRQRRERTRAAACHLDQCRIVKDDVRWKLLPSRLFETPGAQRIP